MIHGCRPDGNTRRTFLGQIVGGAAAAACGASRFAGAADRPARPKVAALFTELRFRSHAYNILENFFQPYLFRGKLVDPGVDVVSFYADQFPNDDMAREVSERLKVPLYPSINAALCCGGRDLAVDAVLLIGEHGDYPYNDLGQHLYPRKQLFDQAIAVMRRAGRFVPLFNDKHLSYRWDWAKEMYDTARQNGMPLMAGSSVPLAERRPPLDLPNDPQFDEALAVHGGGFESYDFHALEIVQSIVEARRGGETGVERVEFLDGHDAEHAAAAGRWSRELFDASIEAERNLQARRQPRPGLGKRPDQIVEQRDRPVTIAHVILTTYRDGTRGTVVATGGSADRWNFACRLRGESQPRATAYFNSPWSNRGLFKALSHAIQYLFVERKEPYPAERTLLTTGVLEAACRSRHDGKPLETPHLAISYRAADWNRFREDGSTWKIITADAPQPTTFDPGDARFVGK